MHVNSVENHVSSVENLMRLLFDKINGKIESVDMEFLLGSNS